MERQRERTGERERWREADGGRGGYKSPWSPIKFMNLDLDRSPVAAVLKYFFFVTRYLFCRPAKVSTVCSIGYLCLFAASVRRHSTLEPHPLRSALSSTLWGIFESVSVNRNYKLSLLIWVILSLSRHLSDSGSLRDSRGQPTLCCANPP